MKRRGSRFLALLLSLLMVVAMFPTMAAADGESATWTKVDLANITSTDTIAITMTNLNNVTYALYTTQTGTQGPDAKVVTLSPDGNSFTTDNAADYGWSVLAVIGGYNLSVGGEYLHTINDNNGVRIGATQAVWSVDSASGYLCSSDGTQTRYLGVYDNNNGAPVSNPNWRAYKNTTGNTKNQTLSFWKLDGGSPPPAPTQVATPTASPAAGAVAGGTMVSFSCSTAEATILYNTVAADYAEAWTEYTQPIEVTEAVTFYVKATKTGLDDSSVEAFAYTIDNVVPISTALAAEAGSFTVKGVVTLVDGKNLYLQDATGGICVRASSTPADVALGDTIIGTGSRTTYNGLPQLGSSTYEKSSGLSLSAKTTTIGALTAADICTYVRLYNLEVTEVFDDDGGYSSPNITVTDGEKFIQIYKAVVNKTDGENWDIAVGDVINVSAAVGVFNTTLQLRTTLASEIEKAGTPSGPLAAGDKVVIYNPSSGKAVSVNAVGTYYRAGTDMTLNSAGGFDKIPADVVWDVAVDANGNYIFSNNGNKLSMNADRNSLPLNEINDSWTVSAATTEGCHYIINANRPTYYVEWYAKYDEFSTYTYNASNESIYAMQLVKVDGPTPEVGLPGDGDQVVLYNVAAEGVLAGQDDNEASPSIENAAATIAGNAATPENGGRVFTVEIDENGYYLFKTEADGYLTSAEAGNAAFYTAEATDYSRWIPETLGDGYRLKNLAAKYVNSSGNQIPQYLEYYSGTYKPYSFYSTSDPNIYTFLFYPVATGLNLTEGVVNVPAVDFGSPADAFVGQDYTLRFSVDAVFGVATLSVKLGEAPIAHTKNADGSYSVTVPAASVTGESLVFTVEGKDNKGVNFSGSHTISIKDEPVITGFSPAAGSQTGEEKKPEISVDFVNAGKDPAATLTLMSGSTKVLDEVAMTVSEGSASYTPAENLADGRYTATVTITRTDEKSCSKSWSFTVGEANYQLFFGQLHSHTQYSDGSGTLESALQYLASIAEHDNVDFVAFTDHSNYFDSSSAANPEGALYDMSLATAASQSTWAGYKGAIADFNAQNNGKLALAGFEMTWSGGPGHINTFNTDGIVSRNNKTLNDKTADAGMKAYYALLSKPEGAGSISQFNHPGSTFGTFSDFAYWDALLDTRIQLIEVGNGEGAIGAGGYYPSYEYYTMALDKGWHLSPTNNQDNHKGRWGNANDARDVILTDDFSEEGLYEAIRNYKLYASEDKNLEILYTANGLDMGSVISDIPETINFAVSVSDPDSTDSISKVELIVNSGRVAHCWDDPAVLATGNLTVTLPSTYSYYYVRVTQGDGNIAVTAPIWFGETLKLGISSFECGTSTPVTDEELTLTTTLFNSESGDATVESLTYSIGDTVIGTDSTGYTIPASGTLAIDFKYTPTAARLMSVTVTAVIKHEDIEYEFSMDVKLDVLDASKLVYIGIDASHYNEYVAGNYSDSMGNFGELAAGYAVRTVELKTSEALISACANAEGKFKAIILTAPSRRLAAAQSDPKTYSAEELAALKAFNAAGGTVILAGWSDNYENYPVIQGNPDIKHMAETQNEILEALGSSLRISDDATYDDVRSAADGVDKWRLYFSSYGWDNFLTEGVEFDAEHPYDRMYTQVFSHYGGASVYAVDAEGQPTSTLPDTVSPVVFGHSSTYSVDVDGDGLGGSSIPKYAYGADDNRLLAMASEELEGQGLIIVSGAAFMSNFEVQATIEDSGAEKNYSNYTICENLVQYINPVTITPIAEVQAEEDEGVKFTIQGVVTSNASGYDKDTAFFDCIYVQDETAGINAFPVAGNYKIGDRVQITGTTSSYQGERQIAVSKITLLGEGEPLEPKLISTKEAAESTYLGSLVKIEGVVVSFAEAEGLVQTIIVRDSSGYDARVFIDGYITTGKTIENLAVGHEIRVVGLSSYDNTFNGAAARIRVRDRADIVCGTEVVDIPPVVNPPAPPIVVPTPEAPFRFADVPEDSWYADAVYSLYEAGIIDGVSDENFAPGSALSRAALATILYRHSGESYSGEAAPFTDLSQDWYAEAIAWAYANDIVDGVSETLFAPDTAVSREQVAVMLLRYARYRGLEASDAAELDSFTDAAEISAYALEAMRWAVAVGIVEGRADNLLAPAGIATRAEACVMLDRLSALL